MTTPFAKRLKALRESRRLSQSGLAKASGISLRTIQDYEQGNREPLLSSAAKLAKGLGVTIDTLADTSGVEQTKRTKRANQK
jgi:transcriptional regulator with XRE-family HTH domain